MMSHLCNRCVRELLILTRTWFAFGLPSKPGVTAIHLISISTFKQKQDMARRKYQWQTVLN
jgi:hypothetical protein